MRVCITTSESGFLGKQRVSVAVGVGDDELHAPRPVDVAVRAMADVVDNLNEEIREEAGPSAMVDICTIPTLKLLAERAVEAVAGADYDVHYVCLKLPESPDGIMVFADNKEG